MINQEKLKNALEGYKDYFPLHWEDEMYKWEAVKAFQDNWNIGAENFGEMFAAATAKTYNLLASGYSYPRSAIIEFAKEDDDAVRNMFKDLFDEQIDLEVRVAEFQQRAENLRVKFDDGSWKNHYQNTNAISTYLWLRYPDRYYIYKYELARSSAAELESDHKPKRDGSVKSMIEGFKLYDEICESIKHDPAIRELLEKALTPSCYPDPEMRTVTIDFDFYITRFYIPERYNAQEEEWLFDDYSPNLSVEDWVGLINDSSIFTPGSLQIMKRILDYGGRATCSQLAVKYGEHWNFYNSGSIALARRVVEATGCDMPPSRNDGLNRWWPVLYVGKDAGKEEEGAFIWKLRDELAKALGKVDLSEVPLYSDAKPAIWKISHGDISRANRDKFLERHVAVVHGMTGKKGVSKVPQGLSFRDEIHEGDYFYLCYGSSVRLLGQFTSKDTKPNSEMQDGWLEREYRVLAESKDKAPYTGIQKWWAPNDNSTCIKVKEDEQDLFEKAILNPYFGMTLDGLFGSDEAATHGYWWLTANPKIWSFGDLQVGEEQSYTFYNENGNKRRIFQNFLDARVGDIVIGYEANPVKKVVAINRITRIDERTAIYFEKLEGLSSPIEYSALKNCPELEKMEFFIQSNGSLFKLSKGEYDFIMDMVREENPLPKEEEANRPYTKQDFLDKVFMSEERFDVLMTLLRNKKNVILQGAPGVGKTFTAKKLAYAMMGEVDDSRIELIQFHQNYSYEDFIMGYRPDGAEFRLTEGIFYRFCQKAANYPNKSYFFIIDEINRGNLSKIFGELLMLIEKDYRDTKATLAYSGMQFSVPGNVYIIGMMNTADRSLAMIDYALRRRFSFFEIEPGFNSEGFTRYQGSFENATFDALIDQIKQLNRDIAKDGSLGPGFRIGHSYFCGREELGCTTEWMREVVEFDIIPTLSEYWFDEPEKLQQWENNLRGVFDD